MRGSPRQPGSAAGDHLVAFKKKPSTYRAAADVNHDEVAKVGPRMMTLRSRDDGRSWERDSLQLRYDLSADQEAMFAAGPQDYSGDAPLDFADADVLVASGATPDYFRPHSRAWIRVSSDGGGTWRRPILAPLVGLPSLSAMPPPSSAPTG